MTEHGQDWATGELADVDLGDRRLDARLIKLCGRFSEAPESPINQACADWAETKAAYRFFQNDKADAGKILSAHRNKTAERCGEHDTVLALQDTSYFIYTDHPKTEGLGRMFLTQGKNTQKSHSGGLLMHTCLAVTTKGVPLGLLDQKIFARDLRPEKEGRHPGGKVDLGALPIEEKESFKWLEALTAATALTPKTQMVTVCDREADIYDFFRLADRLGAQVLVRASSNRTVATPAGCGDRQALGSHGRAVRRGIL